MIKGVFLIGEARSILDYWKGKTKKGHRSFEELGSINGSRLFHGEAEEKEEGGKKFSFYFITLDTRKIHKIQELTTKLGLEDDEVIAIATHREKSWLTLGDGSNKRYQRGKPRLIYLKRNVSYSDVNEIASMLFFNHDKLEDLF